MIAVRPLLPGSLSLPNDPSPSFTHPPTHQPTPSLRPSLRSSVPPSHRPTHITIHGICGTVVVSPSWCAARYCPPESIRLSTSADVYCFGMCLVEIQSRAPPFAHCTTIDEVMHAKQLVRTSATASSRGRLGARTLTRGCRHCGSLGRFKRTQRGWWRIWTPRRCVCALFSPPPPLIRPAPTPVTSPRPPLHVYPPFCQSVVPSTRELRRCLHQTSVPVSLARSHFLYISLLSYFSLTLFSLSLSSLCLFSPPPTLPPPSLPSSPSLMCVSRFLPAATAAGPHPSVHERRPEQSSQRR